MWVVTHRSKKRRASVRNAFADGVPSCVTRNAPNGNEETAVSCQQKQRRKCAPLPWSCLAVFVEIVGGNRVLCFSTIDLTVVINHTGRFERAFAHACAYTTTRPHDRTTARPHNRTTTTNYRGVSGVCQAASPLNNQQKRETQTGNRNAFPFLPALPSKTRRHDQPSDPLRAKPTVATNRATPPPANPTATTSRPTPPPASPVSSAGAPPLEARFRRP